MGNTVRYEKQDNIAIVTIDRAEALNALNSTVIAELEQVVATLENDRDVRCMILTGAGRSFVAGADIGEQYPLDLDGGRRWGQRGSALLRRIEKLEQQQKDLNKLVTAVEVLASREKGVETDVKEIKADVKTITQKSGRRWDAMIDRVLYVLIGAAISLLMTGGSL